MRIPLSYWGYVNEKSTERIINPTLPPERSYEQTYNVINFENKLSGLEARPDYPKEKPWYFRPGKDTNVDYNILSNEDLRTHHFAQPKNRPPEDPPEVVVVVEPPVVVVVVVVVVVEV